MGAEGALDLDAVDHLRPGPALRRAQDDRGPGPVGVGTGPRRALDRGDRRAAVGEGHGEVAVDLARVGAADEARLVAVSRQQGGDPLLARAPEHGRPGDLVFVEVEDRQHGAVARRVEIGDPLPGALQGSGLGLTVADHAGDEQVRMVEGGTEGVDQGVTELAALVDRARSRHADVAGDPARGRELAHEAQQPGLVGGDLRIDLGVGPLEVDVGDHRRAAVAGTGDEEDVVAGRPDHAVELGVDQVQARRGPPVAEQAGLDVLGPQRLAQQRVRPQVDLADGEEVGRLPVGEQGVELGVVRRVHHDRARRLHAKRLPQAAPRSASGRSGPGRAPRARLRPRRSCEGSGRRGSARACRPPTGRRRGSPP